VKNKFIEMAKEAFQREELIKGIKKPEAPYYSFCNLMKKELRKECPKLKSSEISIIIKDSWAKMSKEEKGKLREEYRTKLKNYKSEVDAVLNPKKPVNTDSKSDLAEKKSNEVKFKQNSNPKT
jgi:hypothetical protein